MRPEDWNCDGDRTLLETPRRALLISRTPRRPTPATPWVRAISEAAEAAARAGETLVVGLDRVPFQVALAVCTRTNGAAILVGGEAPAPTARALYEGLIPARHCFVWPRAQQENDSPESLPLRDQLIGALAVNAYAIHVRKRGHMAAVAEQIAARGGNVDTRFAVDAPKQEKLAASELSAFAPALSASDWPYLTHYTREPDGAWPGESPAEHAAWLAFGPRDARRGPCEALARILSMRRMMATGRLMPGGAPMVSFTARPPWHLNELMRWRKGLRRWTVRPYGLAIRRDALEALGARAVSYLDAAALAKLPAHERRFAQKAEWSHEAEWRIGGDLNLASFDRDDMRIVVLSKDGCADANRLREDFAIAPYAQGE